MHVSKKFVLYPVSGLLISGAVAAGSLAGASWLNSGTGSSAVGTGTIAVDITGGTGGTGLVPSGTTPVNITISNHNTWREQLTAVAVTGVTDTTLGTSAADGDVSVALPVADQPTALGSTPVYIPANSSITITGTASMVADPVGSSGDSYKVTVTDATTAK